MPEPMRIAYLTSQYARASDSFIRGEVRQLRRLGCEVFTFSIRRPPEDQDVSAEIRAERERTDDILSHSAGTLLTALLWAACVRPLRFLRTLWRALKTAVPGLKGRCWAIAYACEAVYLARQLTALRIEHLHNHIGEGSATVAMLASELSGVPYSLTVHGPNEFDRPTLLALEAKIARSKFVVGVSRFGRSQLYRWARYKDWPKVHVVHCGVDEQFLDAPATPIPEQPRFVCVGRLAEQKGQLLLVEAVAALLADGIDVEVRFVGDGPLREELERAIRRHGLESHVQILGWRSSDEVRREILASRAMVLPSFAEGLPVVFMEALALHRPVISTYVAGIPELVEDGVTGWLTYASDSESLAEAMRKALLLPAERLEVMGAEGAEWVAEEHDARKEAERLLDLFRSGGKTAATEHPVGERRIFEDSHQVITPSARAAEVLNHAT